MHEKVRLKYDRPSTNQGNPINSNTNCGNNRDRSSLELHKFNMIETQATMTTPFRALTEVELPLTCVTVLFTLKIYLGPTAFRLPEGFLIRGFVENGWDIVKRCNRYQLILITAKVLTRGSLGFSSFLFQNNERYILGYCVERKFQLNLNSLDNSLLRRWSRHISIDSVNAMKYGVQGYVHPKIPRHNRKNDFSIR